MLQQVQIINGQKVLVPLSGSTPTDIVQSGNMSPVTSNAVYDAISERKGFYYNANTDRNTFSNRVNAIREVISASNRKSNIGLIRYNGGYYFSYIIPRKDVTDAVDAVILELDPYTPGGKINMLKWSDNNSISLLRTI